MTTYTEANEAAIDVVDGDKLVTGTLRWSAIVLAANMVRAGRSEAFCRAATVSGGR
ncbi:hypothetical protein PV318_00020 [Streptomyces sp. ME02-6991-2B]|nr:hypothetical protein [Streptomyces sp. ME02-6991-2B]